MASYSEHINDRKALFYRFFKLQECTLPHKYFSEYSIVFAVIPIKGNKLRVLEFLMFALENVQYIHLYNLYLYLYIMRLNTDDFGGFFALD